MMAETRRNFFGLSKTFSGSFLRAGYPARVQVKFKGKQKTQSCRSFRLQVVSPTSRFAYT